MEVQKAYGLYVDPDNNWFTQNVKRFGGGFDMKQLTSQPGLLASKFDRLSSKYDHWVVGNRSQVEYWLSRCARKHASVFGGKSTCMLDVACGIGLPGHQLRLCGFQGHLAGTDISEGMVKQARQRGAHNLLFVANANEGLREIESSSIDLVLCTGALELLDHEAVLSAFSRILTVSGQAWLSFQLEEDAMDGSEMSERHPTAHQNVRGLTRNEIEDKLAAVRLVIDEAECCEEAFYTPSPDQDGSLLPVPYLFLTVQKLA
jgi:predicted TPR repeat methyltransferase